MSVCQSIANTNIIKIFYVLSFLCGEKTKNVKNLDKMHRICVFRHSIYSKKKTNASKTRICHLSNICKYYSLAFLICKKETTAATNDATRDKTAPM